MRYFLLKYENYTAGINRCCHTSHADSEAGRAAYLLGRVTYIRPAADVSWNDIQGFVDFASQVGGTDS